MPSRRPDPALDGPVAPAAPGQALVACLSLGGGGLRGLFTATVLTAFEAAAGAPAATRFDLLAGTSIGGIIAIGLAAGIPAARIADAIRTRAPHIFRRRPLRHYLLTARYPQGPLRQAVQSILGDQAGRRFSDLEVPLLVTAVDQTAGRSHLFRSRGLAAGQADTVTLLDAALATAAAPTFFPPHRIGDHVYADGGLVANAPDLLAVSAAMAHLHAPLPGIHVLSIGTAASPLPGRPFGSTGGLAWLRRHRLVELAVTAQEHAGVDQARRILGTRYLCIDQCPDSPIGMDDLAGLDLLPELARRAVADVASDRRSGWSEAVGREAARLHYRAVPGHYTNV